MNPSPTPVAGNGTENDPFLLEALARLSASNRGHALELGVGESGALGCRFQTTQTSAPDALSTLPAEHFDFILASRVFDENAFLTTIVASVREAGRLLRAGGLLCARLNDLRGSTTLFSVGELEEMARDLDFQILTIDRTRPRSTSILWRKRQPGWRIDLPEHATLASAEIRRIANAWDNGPVVPGRGRYASISIQVEGLPGDIDLLDLAVLIGGFRATAMSIGELDARGWQEIHALLPNLEQTGLIPVELQWFGERLTTSPAHLRVIPPGPSVPRIVNVATGMRAAGITVTVEELARPGEFVAEINGQTVWADEAICVDTAAQRYDVRFHLPEDLPAGRHEIRLKAGRRALPLVSVDIE
ncbi:MAG TPA: hypothetical protein VGL53_20455 [Bryobacteraceae bacterium]|jgi:hypothetical protein